MRLVITRAERGDPRLSSRRAFSSALRICAGALDLLTCGRWVACRARQRFVLMRNTWPSGWRTWNSRTPHGSSVGGWVMSRPSLTQR